MINVYPIHNMILLQEINDPTLGGILEAGETDPNFGVGRVLRFGLGYITKEGRIPLIVKEGDTVLFDKERGQQFTHEETTYRLVSEEDTSAVLGRDPHEFEIENDSPAGELDIEKIIQDAIDELEKDRKKDS